MRSTSRLADVSINTVSKLLVDAGLVCAAFHDENVRGLKSKRVQADEIWSFVGAKGSAQHQSRRRKGGAIAGRGRRSTPTASCSSRFSWATVARPTATTS